MVTNENYLEQLSWVSLRTQANLDLPCSKCGAMDNVVMHHCRHIRKRAYALIPEEATYIQVMSLRNRKKLPICDTCHNMYHAGKNVSNGIIPMAPVTKLVDNSIVHIESFVKPGREYFVKP